MTTITIEVGRSEAHRECLAACVECAELCEACLGEMIGRESHNDCPRCCLECSEICTLCARAFARQSRNIASYCAICEDVCRWCAQECGQHQHDHCKRCAEACRRCAELCGEIAAERSTTN